MKEKKIIFTFFVGCMKNIRTFALAKRRLVSSSSLVRTSGFHPGNRGSNPLETTKIKSCLKMAALFIFNVLANETSGHNRQTE